ncbi:MAG: Uma2 family endonuclease, partial [Acidobacteria bacterium]|nr:Uma2 family endonuclease [Acidobacteriota bacterium]
YERVGVQEYWLVDPDHAIMTVLRRSTQGFDPPSRLSAAANDVLITPLLPGLEIPLQRVLG